jgi:tRNA-dihydrouridine synthase
MMRSRLGWFVKGMRDSSRFRKTLTQVSTREETLSAIEGYEDRLAESAQHGAQTGAASSCPS